MGTIIHEGFIPYFEKQEGMRVVYRENAYENDLFTGHIDGYIKKTKQLFELKTVSTWIYDKIIYPKDEHIQQALVYKDLGVADYVKFVYLNRDSGEYKCFDMDLTTAPMVALSKSLRTKAKEVISMAERGLGAEDVEYDEFEVCDAYCEHQTRPADFAPTVDDNIEDIDNLEEKDELYSLMSEYHTNKQIIKDAKAKQDMAGSKIKDIMERKELREITDCAVYYQNERASFDKEGLEKEYPEIYEQFAKKEKSVYFRVKG